MENTIKVQLKRFPNGAHVVYEGNEYIKLASVVKDHFRLVRCSSVDSSDNQKTNDFCLFLHRDTYVEPLIGMCNDVKEY